MKILKYPKCFEYTCGDTSTLFIAIVEIKEDYIGIDEDIITNFKQNDIEMLKTKHEKGALCRLSRFKKHRNKRWKYIPKIKAILKCHEILLYIPFIQHQFNTKREYWEKYCLEELVLGYNK